MPVSRGKWYIFVRFGFPIKSYPKNCISVSIGVDPDRHEIQTFTESLTRMALVETALIGLVSGGVGGIFVTEYRHLRDGLDTQRRWYSTTERLAQRVVDLNTENTSDMQSLRARDVCSDVYATLSTHIHDAPLKVDNEVLEAAETLISCCYHAMHFAAPREKKEEMERRVESAVGAAEEVSRLAQEHREGVGLLWL